MDFCEIKHIRIYAGSIVAHFVMWDGLLNKDVTLISVQIKNSQIEDGNFVDLISCEKVRRKVLNGTLTLDEALERTNLKEPCILEGLIFAEIVYLVFWSDHWRDHLHVVVALWNDFEMWWFETLKTVVKGLYHSCWRHSREAICIEEVSYDLSNTGFSRENPSPKWFGSEGTYVISWIIGRKSLFIDWLENSKCLFGCSSEDVGATGPIICELGLKSFTEASLDFVDHFNHLFWALHWTKHVDVRSIEISAIWISTVIFLKWELLMLELGNRWTWRVRWIHQTPLSVEFPHQILVGSQLQFDYWAYIV